MGKLSRVERAALQFMLTFRERELTVGGLVRANRKPYLLIVCYFAVAVPVLLALHFLNVADTLPVALVVIGMVAGALLRDLGLFVRSVRAWPVNRAVIDYGKVERLLAEDEVAVAEAEADDEVDGDGDDRPR